MVTRWNAQSKPGRSLELDLNGNGAIFEAQGEAILSYEVKSRTVRIRIMLSGRQKCCETLKINQL